MSGWCFARDGLRSSIPSTTADSPSATISFSPLLCTGFHGLSSGSLESRLLMIALCASSMQAVLIRISGQESPYRRYRREVFPEPGAPVARHVVISVRMYPFLRAFSTCVCKSGMCMGWWEGGGGGGKRREGEERGKKNLREERGREERREE